MQQQNEQQVKKQKRSNVIRCVHTYFETAAKISIFLSIGNKKNQEVGGRKYEAIEIHTSYVISYFLVPTSDFRHQTSGFI